MITEGFEKIIMEEKMNGAYAMSGFPFLEALKTIPQNPLFHGEKDVYTHTLMVIEALLESSAWSFLTPREKKILFLSALFHDIGKRICTIEENGLITSPRHASKGAKMARTDLWKGIPEPVPFKGLGKKDLSQTEVLTHLTFVRSSVENIQT